MNWKFIFVVVLLVVGGVGFYLFNQEPPKPPEPDPMTERLHRYQDKAQVAVSADRVADVQAAIERYKVSKEANPTSLEDLVPHYLDHVPAGLQYDPASGVVSAAP
jgi:hypothetical protein